MRDVVVSACHYVLRESASVDSPIHWKKPQGQGPAKKVNDYLVKMFEMLLKDADCVESLEDPVAVSKDIVREINRQIYREQP